MFDLVSELSEPLPVPPGKTLPQWLQETAPGSAQIWQELEQARSRPGPS